MALLTLSGNVALDSPGQLAVALDNMARSLVGDLDAWIARCDAGSLNAHSFMVDFYLGRLLVTRDRWAVKAAISGANVAIRTLFPGKFASDAAATTELSNIQTAMTTLVDYISTTVQGSILQNASGYLEVIKITAGALEFRTVTNAGQLASLKTQLQTLRSAIAA